MVVVQSEFGCCLCQNVNCGIDYGYGNLMLFMGGLVNGGFYGDWLGLVMGQFFDQVDFNVIMDYCQVFFEIFI